MMDESAGKVGRHHLERRAYLYVAASQPYGRSSRTPRAPNDSMPSRDGRLHWGGPPSG